MTRNLKDSKSQELYRPTSCLDFRKSDQCEDKRSSLYCQECELKYCVGCNAMFHAKVYSKNICKKD